MQYVRNGATASDRPAYHDRPLGAHIGVTRRVVRIVQSLPVPFDHRRRKLGRACVEQELARSHAARVDLGVYERLISTGA